MNHTTSNRPGTHVGLTAVLLATGALSACQSADQSVTEGISPAQFTDALFAVMEADRTVYTRQVVNRLANEEQVITASEHWQDDRALPLPAQMFRYGSELAAERTDAFSYTLQSLWPINEHNEPRTETEREGLRFVADNPGENYYGEEELGGVRYFTAVYPDVAVSPACVNCHNDHRDTPRSDFELDEVMGGVVIRVPLR